MCLYKLQSVPMRKQFRPLVFLVAVVSGPLALHARGVQTRPLVLDNLRVIDGSGAPPIEHGHVRFWEQQHRVEVDGEPREMPPKEYELLRLLLHHPGQVFGRETLLREIWGYDFLGDSRTVDVHVQRLRARVERDPANPRLIKTVRGFGYRLALASEL